MPQTHEERFLREFLHKKLLFELNSYYHQRLKLIQQRHFDQLFIYIRSHKH